MSVNINLSLSIWPYEITYLYRVSSVLFYTFKDFLKEDKQKYALKFLNSIKISTFFF